MRKTKKKIDRELFFNAVIFKIKWPTSRRLLDRLFHVIIPNANATHIYTYFRGSARIFYSNYDLTQLIGNLRSLRASIRARKRDFDGNLESYAYGCKKSCMIWRCWIITFQLKSLSHFCQLIHDGIAINSQYYLTVFSIFCLY